MKKEKTVQLPGWVKTFEDLHSYATHLDNRWKKARAQLDWFQVNVVLSEEQLGQLDKIASSFDEENEGRE